MYQYYSDHKTYVICVSSYAGKTVRGVAKCSPEDEFNMSYGMELARARCDVKVAKKRLHRAAAQRKEAMNNLFNAKDRYAKMEDYFYDAEYEVDYSEEQLREILESR